MIRAESTHGTKMLSRQTDDTSFNPTGLNVILLASMTQLSKKGYCLNAQIQIEDFLPHIR
jgi:hypothetical protein